MEISNWNHYKTLSTVNRKRKSWTVIKWVYKFLIICLLKKYEKLFAVKIKRKLKSKGIILTVSNRSVRRYVNRIKQNTAVKQKRYYEPVIDMVGNLFSVFVLCLWPWPILANFYFLCWLLFEYLTFNTQIVSKKDIFLNFRWLFKNWLRIN